MSTAAPAAWEPRICTVASIHGPGCRFHVGSATENYRVKHHGGELDFTQRMIQAIRPGDVFFDIGACVGLVSVHAAVAGAKVVAFEPEPAFRKRLTENLALNDLAKQVQVVPWAVSDVAAATSLFTDGQHGNSPSLRGGGNRQKVEIRTNTLDAALAAGELPWPSVLKIDIEGAEVRALRGMENLLGGNRRPREIFIEAHPVYLKQFDDSMDELYERLRNAHYALVDEHGRDDQLHQIWQSR